MRPVPEQFGNWVGNLHSMIHSLSFIMESIHCQWATDDPVTDWVSYFMPVICNGILIYPINELFGWKSWAWFEETGIFSIIT